MNCWILTNGRSGSTWLCELLNNTCLFPDSFGERFHPNHHHEFDFHNHPEQYSFSKVIRSHFVIYFNDNDKQYIENKLKGIKYILLRRFNTIDQAISRYFGEQTNIWSISEEQELEEYLNKEVNIYKEKLFQMYINEEKNQNEWLNYLQGSNYLEIYYEDLLKDTQKELHKIFDYLEIRVDNQVIENTLKKKNYLKMTRPENVYCKTIIQEMILLNSTK